MLAIILVHDKTGKKTTLRGNPLGNVGISNIWKPNGKSSNMVSTHGTKTNNSTMWTRSITIININAVYKNEPGLSLLGD